jgi:hypothetical protein
MMTTSLTRFQSPPTTKSPTHPAANLRTVVQRKTDQTGTSSTGRPSLYSLYHFLSMKTFKQFSLLVGIFAIMQATVIAQVAVNVDNPTNTTPNLAASYTSLADAITALSGITAISGPVTLTAAAGAETAPAGGYVINFVAATTATNNVTITGTPTTTITASGAHTVGALNDAIFKIIGSDFVTIRDFTMQENPANTTTVVATNNMTEWGVALLYASTTNGAKSNSIRSNTISLSRLYSNTFGVYSNVRHNNIDPLTAADATLASGSNSDNKVYSNAISNVNFGIVFVGSSIAVAMDTGNDIGGSSSATANTITNWGGHVSGAPSIFVSVTSSSSGIHMVHQVGDNVSFNIVISAAITTLSTTGLIGIFKGYFVGQPTGHTFTSNYNNNSVTLTNAPTTAQMTGIGMQGLTTLASATFNCNGNNIINCANTGASVGAATMIGMLHSSAPGTFNINGNTIRGFTTNTTTTGGFVGIQQQTNGVVNALNLNNNKIGDGIAGAITFNNTTGAANVVGISVSATPTTGAAPTCALSMTGNDFRGITYATSGSGAHTYIVNSAACLSQNISNNTFTNLNVNTTGSVTFISNSVNAPAAGFKTVNGNSIVGSFNKGGAGGTVALYNDAGSSVASAGIQNNNNDFSNLTVTGATTVSGWFNQDGVGATPAKTMTGNTFSNWSCGTSPVTVFQSNFGNLVTMTGNTVSNIIGQGNITGIAVGSSGTYNTALNLSGNTVTGLISTGTGGAVTGLSYAAPAPLSGTNSVNTNTINTLSSTSTTATVAGISSAGSGVNISNHTISAVSCAGTSSGVANGIMITGGNNVNVFKNKIYDVQTTGAFTTTPGVNGIVLSGTSTLSNYNVYNNLIGDLKAPTSASTDAVRGISVTATGTNSNFNIYYNTVNLSASSTGINFGTSGLFHAASATTTTAALNFRNNIIVNNSTPAGTGLVTCFRRSSTNLGNYASTSNSNDFFTTTGSVMYDGTTAFNIAAFKAAVGSRDMASFSQDPVFQSTAGANANFLKFDVVSAKQVESGAANIAAYTDDYFGTIRQGNGGYAGTGTAPDIGAWELEGIPQDLVGPTIAYTALANTSCTTDRTFTPVTTTDGSGVNTTAGTRPRLYYKKSGNADAYIDNTNATNGWKFVEATGAGGSPFSFTTNYALLFGGLPVAGDVIQYFVVAQDLAGTPNIAINSGSFAALPSSVALTGAAFPIGGTVNSYTITNAGLSGTVTIGATGTFTSLTGVGGLFSAINTVGLTGNLTANILDAAVAETGANALNVINNAGCAAGTYTVTIKPNTGVTTVLSGSVAGPLVDLNGADNVTFDGSNNGSTSKDMTIRNTNTGGQTFRFINEATGNTIKNTIVEGANTSATSGTVLFDIVSAGTTGNSNNTINNCDVRDRSDAAGVPANAIYSSGNPAGPNASNTISGCNVFNYTSTGILVTATGAGNGWTVNPSSFYQTAARTTALTGISIQGGSGHSILNNSIGGTAPLAGGANLSTSSTFRGIDLSVGTASATSVQGNTVKNIRSTSVAATASYGIFLQAGRANIGNVSGNTIGSSDVAERYEINGNSYGIRVISTSTVNLSNNTVNNFGSNATPPTAQFYFGISVEGTGGTHTVLNNTVRNVTNASTPSATVNTQTIGMFVSGTGVQTVRGNTIRDVGCTSAAAPAAFNNRIWGLIVSATAVGTVVEKNTIFNIYGSSAGTGARGDQVYGMFTQALANCTFSNNMVSLDGGTSADRQISGFLDLSGTVSNYYFNSVNIIGTALGTNSTYAFNRNFATTVNIRNNIFNNTRTGGTGFHVALANTNGAATGWPSTASNYNDLNNATASHLTQWLGAAAGNNLTLAGWQGASGGDANSVSIAPVFTSATDLHLPAASNPTLFDLGTNIPGITTDIDNEGRSATAPDMGADEFSPITLNLTAFIEGYYIGGSAMTPVHLNVVTAGFTVPGNASPTSTQCDFITVELRNSTPPYAVAASYTGILATNGTLACEFPSDKVGGTYFIALKHRNSLETWSGAGADAPTFFATATTSYNFSSAADQAYMSNMVDMGGGVWAIYAGEMDDLNMNGLGDGVIDNTDFGVWLIDSENFEEGYVRTDLNGDAVSDNIDFGIWLINSENFVEVLKP